MVLGRALAKAFTRVFTNTLNFDMAFTIALLVRGSGHVRHLVCELTLTMRHFVPPSMQMETTSGPDGGAGKSKSCMAAKPTLENTWGSSNLSLRASRSAHSSRQVAFSRRDQNLPLDAPAGARKR